MEKGNSNTVGKGLDYLNFLLADVRDGIGPFLGIYLLSDRHWNLRDIGIVTSIMTFAGVIAQTPAGHLLISTGINMLSLSLLHCCLESAQ